MDSRFPSDGKLLPIVPLLTTHLEIVLPIKNATQRLTRDDLGVQTPQFCFLGWNCRLVLQYEDGNLVLHLQKDSLTLEDQEVFHGVGICNSGTNLMYDWHEAKVLLQTTNRTSYRLWTGPSKRYLLENGKTLFPNDHFCICIALSQSNSVSCSFGQHQKVTEPTEDCAASNPTAVAQKGSVEREEDRLSPNFRALTALSKNLKDLYLEDKDHDARIIVGNKTFGAHRAILKARSPVLSAMLSSDMLEAHTGEIRLEDCHSDDFAVFLLFLYSGTVEGLTSDNVLPVYDIADKYDVPELVQACIQHILSNLTVHTVSDVIGLALKHNESKLLQEATDFFVKHAEEIFPTVEWQRFHGDNPTQANELVIKSFSFMKSQKA